jgi:formylglycine-generating enzyme required for sulfatase activity
MPSSRALPIVFGVLIFTICAIADVYGQTSAPQATTAQTTDKPPLMSDIAFYVAYGDTDACGHGCKEWIAAEGKIDPRAAQRLRQLLAKLGRRKPPIFLHSPGGSVKGSIELGRLIREQRLEVSVAHTIPRGCAQDKLLDKSCDALKRSGQELEADLDPDSAMCNSACVWTFSGGTERLVPPGVKLAIHDVGLDPEKPLPTITTTRTTRTIMGTTTTTRTATSTRVASLAEVKRASHAWLLDYLHDMRIDKELLAATIAVPHESARFLERDELVHFGIDRREFGETAWRFRSEPATTIIKTFFARVRSGDRPRFREGFVMLGCGGGFGREIRLSFAQERDSSEQKFADSVLIDVNGQRIVLRTQIPSPKFDIRATTLSADMFDLIGHGANFKISGILLGQDDVSAGSLTLNLDGYSAASVKLRKNCDQAVGNVIAATPWVGSGSSVSFTKFPATAVASPVGPVVLPAASPSRDTFKDCDKCPEMVVVPAGSFTMGSPDNERDRRFQEGPQHRVTFDRAFAAGKFAVTFDEWDECVADGGCSGYQPADQGWGRGRRPVINISWNDAKTYVAWLSRKTGKTYRLLSEAEREYVTRAGTSTSFWWGSAITTSQANYDPRGSYDGNGGIEEPYRQRTEPVDAFEPNPWGLYQVHGNVWEWTQDCYHGSYNGAPTDGSAWTSEDCSLRILRGGSWNFSPSYLRAAHRLAGTPDNRVFGNAVGFRVGRSLTP